MKRYGGYLVNENATIYALAMRFTEAALRLAKCDIRSLAWKEKRAEHSDTLRGLTRLTFDIRNLPNGGREETEYYCAPEDCVYKPLWQEVSPSTHESVRSQV